VTQQDASTADRNMPQLKIALEIASAEPELQLETLFKPPKQGFLGADGALSIPLTATKSVWIFGDTFVGEPSASIRRGSTFIRNSVAVLDRSSNPLGEVTFYWDRHSDKPSSFFPHDGIHWHWAGTGTMVDGMLFLFCYKLEPATNFFQFRIVDLCLIRVENPLDCPEQWAFEITDLGFGNLDKGYCSAAYAADGFIYLLGFDHLLMKSRTVLARVSVEALKSHPSRQCFEFWAHGKSGSFWSAEEHNLESILSEGVAESALQRVGDLFVYTTFTPFDPAIRLYFAQDIRGPWEGPIHVYDVPDHQKAKTVFSYAAKPHPELSSDPGEIILTYAANCSDFDRVLDDLELYYPRFVRVRLRSTPLG